MKQVHIRRHAPKHAEGYLTEEGKKLASELKITLVKFDLVISSDKPRAVETAVLLTGKNPTIDKRAGTPPFTLDQEKELHILGQNHPFGIAGVIFDTLNYRDIIIAQGKKLAELIKETLEKLPENGVALIISHDGVMVTAERILKNLSLDKADKTFKPLRGFRVLEDGKNRVFSII